MKFECFKSCDFCDSYFTKFEFINDCLVIKVKLWKDNFVDICFKDVKFFSMEDGVGDVRPFIIKDKEVIDDFFKFNLISYNEEINLYFLEDRYEVPAIKVLASEIKMVDSLEE